MLGERAILKEPAEAVVVNLTFSKAYLDYYDNKIYCRFQNNARKGIGYEIYRRFMMHSLSLSKKIK